MTAPTTITRAHCDNRTFFSESRNTFATLAVWLKVTKTSIVIGALLISAAIVAAVAIANRPRRVVIEAPLNVTFPEQGFSHATLEGLLRRYVTPEGQVDYAGWHASATDVAALDSYLAAVSRFSPETSPLRFPQRSDELAYWLYGYNAYVIKGVLDRWPLSSVTDVKAPIEAVTGLGFFYQLRFAFGGDYLSLFAVENQKIRERYRYARIHFVLNCASESCPVARPELPTGDALEELLARAAREFINDPDNVAVDYSLQTVYLSTIFKWYKKDFINDLRASGRPAERGLIDYVAGFASGALSSDLNRAGDYRIEFREYDWRLNDNS